MTVNILRMPKEKAEKTKKLSTEPYKGTRDFYPEEKFVQKYIFEKMRDIVERYGYSEYDASLLEDTPSRSDCG